MDEAQVKAMIEAALGSCLKSAFSEFRSHFAEQLSPINDRLSQFEASTTAAPLTPEVPEVPTANPETAALMQRLAKMETQEVERQQELRSYKFGNELTSNIAKYNPLHGDTVKELLNTRYAGKVIEKDGQWYLPSGAKLSEEVDSFFKSDIGLHFTANPATGGGTVTSSAPTNQPKGKATADDMLADFTL